VSAEIGVDSRIHSTPEKAKHDNEPTTKREKRENVGPLIYMNAPRIRRTWAMSFINRVATVGKMKKRKKLPTL